MSKSRNKVEEIRDLPYLHPKIDPSHVDTAGGDPLESAPLAKGYGLPVLVHEGQQYFRYCQPIDGQSILPHGLLGEGGFGSVWLAQNAETKEWIALKQLHTRVPQDQTAAGIEYEQAAAKLRFDKEVANLKMAGQCLFSEKIGDNYFIGMRLIPGVELKVLASPKTSHNQELSIIQRLMIAKNLLKKAAYLHKDKQGVIDRTPENERNKMQHRDLKARNAIVDESLKITLVDLGLAGEVEKIPILERARGIGKVRISNRKPLVRIKTNISSPEQQRLAKNATKGKTVGGKMGTPTYMAPEIVNAKSGQAVYNEATEVYALGITIGKLLGLVKPRVDREGRKSFVSQPIDVLPPEQRDVIKSDNQLPPELREVAAIIRRMTYFNPEKRLTVVQAAGDLNKALANLSQLEGMGLNVAVINIDDYLKLDTFQRAALFQNHSFNAVALCTNKKFDPQCYLKAKYSLEKNGISLVTPVVFKGRNNAAIREHVKGYYDMNYSLHTKISYLKLTAFMKGYLIRRLYYIYPSFWVVFFLVFFFGFIYAGTSIFITPDNILRTALLFITATFNFFIFDPSTPKSLIPLWTLTVEEQFYLAFPIFLLLTRDNTQRAKILIGAILVITFILRPLTLYNYGIQGTFFTQMRCDSIMYGCLIYIMSQQPWFDSLKPKASGNRWFKMFIVVLLLSLILGLTFINLSPAVTLPIKYLFISLLLLLAVFDRNIVSFPAVIQKPLDYLAPRTYSLFLIHVPIIIMTQVVFLSGVVPYPHVAIRIITALVFVFVFNEILYRVVLVPLRNKGRRISARIMERAEKKAAGT